MSNESILTCNSTSFTPEQKMLFEKYGWWMETMGHLVLGSFGIVINCITIFIMSRSNMRKSLFNCLLQCLAVFDTLYLCCELSEFYRHIYNTMVQQHVFVNFIYPVRNMLMGSSLCITVSLAYERYHALLNPATYRVRAMTNMGRRIFRYLLFVLIFNVVLYSPKFNDLKVEELTNCTPKTNETAREIVLLYRDLYYTVINNITIENSTALKNIRNLADEICTAEYRLSATEQRYDYHYVFWYINVTNIIFTVVIPFVLLAYLNYNIYIAYQRFGTRQLSNNSSSSVGRKRRNDIKKTKILFLVVLLFVVCHSVRVAMNINECVTMSNLNIKNFKDYEKAESKGCDVESIWTKYAKPLNQLLLIINATLNFFIYLLFDNGFKDEIKQVAAIKCVLRKFGINTIRTNANNIQMSAMNGNNV